MLGEKEKTEEDVLRSKGGLTGKMEGEIELLQRHVEILRAIVKSQPIGIIKLSEMLKCPQHKVRYSLRLLEQEGLIEPSAEGAITTRKLNGFVEHLKIVLDSMSARLRTIKESLPIQRQINK